MRQWRTSRDEGCDEGHRVGRQVGPAAGLGSCPALGGSALPWEVVSVMRRLTRGLGSCEQQHSQEGGGGRCQLVRRSGAGAASFGSLCSGSGAGVAQWPVSAEVTGSLSCPTGSGWRVGGVGLGVL